MSWFSFSGLLIHVPNNLLLCHKQFAIVIQHPTVQLTNKRHVSQERGDEEFLHNKGFNEYQTEETQEHMERRLTTDRKHRAEQTINR